MLRSAARYLRLLGPRGFLTASRAKATGSTALCVVKVPELRHPLSLRVPSSDYLTYRQIFVRREYDFATRRDPDTIIDAGAHIGLAAVLFASRFPNARIVAVEPARNNYDLLVVNTLPYPNITAVHAALWSEDCQIRLVDPGHGEWAYMTNDWASTPGDAESDSAFVHEVSGLSLDTLMRRFDMEHVDLLKIDIEGSEREVFQDPSAWIDHVDSIVIELHELMRIGCNRNFYKATNGFSHEWMLGENVVVSRDEGFLTPRHGR